MFVGACIHVESYTIWDFIAVKKWQKGREHQCLKLHTVITAFTGTVPEKGILYPHGNAKKSSPHIRTAPSVLKEAGETYKDPSVHYKE